MENFEVKLTKRDGKLIVDITDYEAKKGSGELDMGEYGKGGTMAIMAKIVIDNCQRILNLTPEEIKKEKEELESDIPF